VRVSIAFLVKCRTGSCGGEENNLSLEEIKICALGALYHGDRPEYLRSCLKSLRDQTLKIPIIMVVDGPISGELEDVLKEFDDLGMELIRNAKNGGLANALQLGINLIALEYEYAIRFDADDVNVNHRFEAIRNYFIATKVDLVSSHMKEMDENGVIFSERVVPVGAAQVRKMIPYRNPINHPASAFKISSVIAVGGYRDMAFFEDWYLWARMLNAGCTVDNIDEHLVNFRATDDMVARRYGLSYVKNEAIFFLRRGEEGLVNPFENLAAFTARLMVKMFGFTAYKNIFYWIRK